MRREGDLWETSKLMFFFNLDSKKRLILQLTLPFYVHHPFLFSSPQTSVIESSLLSDLPDLGPSFTKALSILLQVNLSDTQMSLL